MEKAWQTATEVLPILSYWAVYAVGPVKANFSYPFSPRNLGLGERDSRGKQKAADTVSALDPPGQGGFSGSGQIGDVCKAGPLLLWNTPPASLARGCHSWNLRLPLCCVLLEVNCVVVSLGRAATSSFWCRYNVQWHLPPARSPVTASCSSCRMVIGWEGAVTTDPLP